MSQLPRETRDAAIRVLTTHHATDLIPMLGLDKPRRGRASQHGAACKVDGCADPASRKEMCLRHYHKAWRAEATAAGRIRTHGLGGYGLGCRCDVCLTAKHAAWRRSNDARKAERRARRG